VHNAVAEVGEDAGAGEAAHGGAAPAFEAGEEEAGARGDGAEAARGMVKAWMQERGASQADLARRAEIDPSRVGRFLRGRIKAKTAARIYRAVHAELDAAQRLTLLHGLGLYEIAEALAPLLRERE
jgi:hypothetical protein